jgi:hypothetical protein
MNKPPDRRKFRLSWLRMFVLLGCCHLALWSLNTVKAQEQIVTTNTAASKTGAPAREKTRGELERELLLPLLQQERVLSERCGPEHRDLLAIKGKIAATRDYLATIPVAPPSPPRSESAPVWPNKSTQADWTTAKPAAFGSGFERTGSSGRSGSSNEIQQTGYTVPSQSRPNVPAAFVVPSSTRLLGDAGSLGVKPEEKVAAPAPSKPPEMPTKVASLSSLDQTPSPVKVAAVEQKSMPLPTAVPASADLVRYALDGNPPLAGNYFLRISSGQLIGIIAGLLACFVGQLVAFWLILRRYAARLAQSAGQVAMLEREFPTAPASAPSTEAIDQNLHGLYVDHPSFDVSSVAPLGPTWAEELERQEAEKNRQGQALLQELFQQNLDLRKQVIASAEAS